MMIRRIGEEKYLLKEIGPIQNSTLFDQESGQFSCLLMVGELILCYHITHQRSIRSMNRYYENPHLKTGFQNLTSLRMRKQFGHHSEAKNQ